MPCARLCEPRPRSGGHQRRAAPQRRLLELAAGRHASHQAAVPQFVRKPHDDDVDERPLNGSLGCKHGGVCAGNPVVSPVAAPNVNWWVYRQRCGKQLEHTVKVAARIAATACGDPRAAMSLVDRRNRRTCVPLSRRIGQHGGVYVPCRGHWCERVCGVPRRRRGVSAHHQAPWRQRDVALGPGSDDAARRSPGEGACWPRTPPWWRVAGAAVSLVVDGGWWWRTGGGAWV